MADCDFGKRKEALEREAVPESDMIDPPGEIDLVRHLRRGTVVNLDTLPIIHDLEAINAKMQSTSPGR
jgi:hypothetical protein